MTYILQREDRGYHLGLESPQRAIPSFKNDVNGGA